jgi:CRISPR/Cas system-associated protein Cas5 (RAMP superfamily)
MENDNKKYDDFIKTYNRIRNNAVFFLEKYYNIVHPDQIVELSDDEKQELFDEFKGIPFFGDAVNAFDKFNKYQKKIEELKNKGYKDWEIH